MADLTGMLQAAAGSAGVEGWDLANASYNGSPISWFRVSGQEVSPTGLFFKPDGTKMYIIGTSGDDVNEYNLSTAWSIFTASYVQNFSVASQETAPGDVSFKDDGTKMYVIGINGDAAHEYSLSSAWDISTASYVRTFSVASQDLLPNGFFFKPDGTKMYVVGSTNDAIFEYSLSTAWNISTASYVQNFSVASQDATPVGAFFKPDGTKMYVIGAAGDAVYEYNLSSAWDISSASYVQNFSIASQEGSPNAVFFKDDGTKMYIVGQGEDEVYEYNLSSAWDISTASFTSPTTNYFSVASQALTPQAVFFKPDGTKMYILDDVGGDDVNEYSLSTAWDVTSASYVQNFSIAAQETTPQGLFFKDDGTKMYVLGSNGDDVNEYSLSSAWDISSASYVQNFSVVGQDTGPLDLFFKPDGTKMYITGTTGDSVYEYNLSSAWDISSASYVQSFSVASQETAPFGLFFKSDGTKMYVCGNKLNQAAGAVYEYNLSSAWDISTASYVQSFSVSSIQRYPTGLFFKPDGTKMYISDLEDDAVFSYDL